MQNVVDVTFPNMTAQVDKFAKSAAQSFGLSETMAKKYTGTFGAMAKAFGFSEQEAYQMGTALTGLAGDVASFYNISQDEAYTKLKSVFSGETETLKDLGVVMTQNALDAYAMANGYGKTTQAMTEAEKVALRFAFVQDQLSASAGDFARTSDSWANQVRILSLQFDSLKASIGQGLINLFTPIIKTINILIGKLAVLANAFKAFTELITGKKSAGAQIASAGESAEKGLEGATGAADNLAGAASGAGKAAKKAAKEMRALMGFDQVNKLDKQPDSGSSGGGGGSGGGGAAGSGMDFGSLAEGETVVDKVGSSVNGLIARVKELAELFRLGFTIGVGDLSVLDTIRQSLKSIKKSLVEIFTDPQVSAAAESFGNTLALNLGKVAGSVASIGLTIADNLLGGIAKYLEQNTPIIKDYLISMFEIGEDIAILTGNFSQAAAEIFSVFRSDEAKQITADIIAIFVNAAMGLSELAGKIGRDIMKTFLGPVIDCKDQLKGNLEGLLAAVEPAFGGIKDLVTNTFQKINEVYDKYIAPANEDGRKKLSQILNKVTEAFDQYLIPVIGRIGKNIKELANDHIQPAINSFLEFAGKVAKAVSDIGNVISPFIGWLVKEFIGVVASKIDWLWEKLKMKIQFFADLFKVIFDVLNGVIDFITGVFTGDMEKAGEGIKEIFSGITDFIENICRGIKDFFTDAAEMIGGVFAHIPDALKQQFSDAYNNIKNVFSNIGDWFGEKRNDINSKFSSIAGWFKDKFQKAYSNVKKAFSSIGSWFGTKASAVKSKFTGFPGWFQDKFKKTCSNVKSAFSSIGTWFGTKATEIKNKFTGIPGHFKEKFDSAWENVKGAFSGVGSFFDGVWSTIKGKFSTIGTQIGDAIGGAFKSVINSVLTTVENTVNKGIGFINGAIGTINKLLKLNVPKMDTVSLPRLAQGGFVKKNTPQLALIGDNRHQGEVVAPEDKLKEMAAQAVKEAGASGGVTGDELKQIINNAVMRIVSALYSLGFNLDGEQLAKAEKIIQKGLDRRYNTVELV